MPDWFEGKPADISWYPPDNEEKGKKLGEFFQTVAAPPKTVARVDKVMAELKSSNPGVQEWGVVGYCWGGKVRRDIRRTTRPRLTAPDCQFDLAIGNGFQGGRNLSSGHGRSEGCSQSHHPDAHDPEQR